MIQITQDLFGVLPSSVPIYRFVLRNRHGVEIAISEFGGAITSIQTPDKDGHLAEITLGLRSLEEYVHDLFYCGTIVGRYANRIAGATFMLEREKIHLTANAGSHHLHGGVHGFNKQPWRGTVVNAADMPYVELQRISPAGEEGYPGKLHTRISYTLDDKNRLSVCIRATSDKPTIANLTQHLYFNLTGHQGKDVLDHNLVIFAETFLPTDDHGIPLGFKQHVRGTPMDFRTPHSIGERIDEDLKALARVQGYDHCWVLDSQESELRPAATLTEPISGRQVDIHTNAPGLQFYSGNLLPTEAGRDSGSRLVYRRGVCLEPQLFPDSPNHPEFPSPVLLPGEVYSHDMVFQFGVRENQSKS